MLNRRPDSDFAMAGSMAGGGGGVRIDGPEAADGGTTGMAWCVVAKADASDIKRP
jgi:hypothetical protein